MRHGVQEGLGLPRNAVNEREVWRLQRLRAEDPAPHHLRKEVTVSAPQPVACADYDAVTGALVQVKDQ